MFVLLNTTENYRGLNHCWLPVVSCERDSGGSIVRVTCIIHDHRLRTKDDWPGGFFTADFYTAEIVATTETPQIDINRYRNSVYGLSPFHVGSKLFVEREILPGHFINGFFDQGEQTVKLEYFTDEPAQASLDFSPLADAILGESA